MKNAPGGDFFLDFLGFLAQDGIEGSDLNAQDGL